MIQYLTLYGAEQTTAVAKRPERNYIGIDISKEYCRKAENRLKNTTVNIWFILRYGKFTI
jgi:DNA modification methylase